MIRLAEGTVWHSGSFSATVVKMSQLRLVAMNLKPKCDRAASAYALLGVLAATAVTVGVYSMFGLPGLYAAVGIGVTVWR